MAFDVELESDRYDRGCTAVIVLVASVYLSHSEQTTNGCQPQGISFISAARAFPFTCEKYALAFFKVLK